MNNGSKFRAIPPHLGGFKIPFKLEETELLNWLIDLTHCEGREACSQTLSLLQTLNKSELSFKNRLLFLKLINEYLKHYINSLAGSCWDAGFPLSLEENVYAEMVTWNYLLLGQGFFIAADGANKKNDTVLVLGMALQSMGQAQLHIAATYSTPSDGFWSQLYQIFSWAEKRKLQHLPIEEPTFKGLTINTLFARSLIFQVCDTNQFHSRDMRTIFNFLANVCVDLTISVHSGEAQELFMLDLKADNPPLNVKAQIELGSHLVRYFSPVTVAQAIHRIIEQGDVWNGTLKAINNTLFRRVVKTLELKQKRQYDRKKEGYSLLGVIGFEDIIGFLYKATKNALVEPQPTRKEKAKPASPLQKLSLYVDMPETEGRTMMGRNEDDYLAQKLAAAKQQIWQQNQTSSETPVKKVSLKEIKVFDSSANGYSVSWNQPCTKAKIGDLFGIISEDRKRLEIAIIRRIALSSGNIIRRIALETGNEFINDLSSDFRFGAELLGFESEIVYLAGVKKPNQGTRAVFIPGIELLSRPDTLIYSVGFFNPGEDIYIYRANKILLGSLRKELHSTTNISHVEVAFRENTEQDLHSN
jgi:hypothetical protein